MAENVVAAGGRVALLDVNAAPARRSAATLGERATFIETDVTSEAAVNAAVAAASQAMGGINVAVNCAGVGWPKRMVGKDGPMPGDFFRKVIEINLVGTLLVCKAAAAQMQKNAPNADGERGAIIMTASVAAFDGQIGQVAYSASKGGVVGMTLPMARELAAFGIRVVTIAPGPVPHADDGGAAARSAGVARQAGAVPAAARPAGRSTPSFVRQIVENPMLNGETIRLDGAIRMAPR